MGTKVVISKRLVFVNSVSGVATQVLNIAVLLWLYQYLLKRISTEEYALYPVLASLIAFLPLLSTVLTGGLSRYVVEAYAKGDERRITQIASTMSVLLLGVGLLILSAGLVFAWYVDHVLNVVPERLWDARVMMTLMVSSFVIQTVLVPFRIGLYAQQKFVLLNVIALSTQLLRIAILLALLLGVSTRVLWVVVASVFSDICGLLVTVAISRRLIPALTFRRSEIRWGVAKEVTSFGGWTLLAQFAEMIRMASNPIILNKLATSLDVTCFQLGSMPFSQIQQFSSVAQQPLMPPLTAMHAAESKDRLGSAYLRGGRFGLWATLFLSIPLMIYSQELVKLYVGATFGAAAMVIILMLAWYPIAYGNVMMANIAIATAQVRPLALRAIVVQMINLLLTLYLVGVRGMGAVGSALGTFLATILIYPVTSITLGLRLADVSIGRWLRETVWPGWLPGLAAATACILLKITIRPSSWLGLAGCVVCGLLCYVIVLLAFCLQPRDRNDLLKMISTIVGKTHKIFAKKKVHTIRSFKQSENPWVRNEIIHLLESGTMDAFPSYAGKIEHVMKTMFESLTGTIRKTSFRHELVEMDTGTVLEGVSSPRQAGILLNELVKIIRPRWTVELGSAFGIGTMYMADAMLENRIGTLDGIEYESWRAEAANNYLQAHWSNIARIHSGRIEDVLPKLASAHSPADFAFVDAVHKYDDCITYHELLCKVLAEGATAVYDDINFSSDMLRFWKTLIKDPNITDALLINGRWGIVRYGNLQIS